MDRHDEVVREIERYVGEHQHEFLNGACWALFDHLRKRFTGSRPIHDMLVGHILTEIDGRYYDANGEVGYPTHPHVLPLSHRPGISQMRRSARKILRQIGHWDAELLSIEQSRSRKITRTRHAR